MVQSSFALGSSRTGESDTLQMVSFRLGKEKYALSIMNVKEVLPLAGKDVYPLPSTPAYVEGIFNLREEIIPLISLHEKFDLERVELSEEDRLLSGALIVILEGALIGIRIDKILGVLYLDRKNIIAVPEIVMTGMAKENIQGVYREEDESYLNILDLKQLFSGDEVSSLSHLRQIPLSKV